MTKVIEYREKFNIVAEYNCGKCGEKVEDFRYKEKGIRKFKYCPYCGEEIEWKNI